MDSGLHCYLHIPFCRARCPYCDFCLVTKQDLQDRFFSALEKETAARLSLLEGVVLKSVHFGGGTPSFVPVSYLESWLETLTKYVSLCDGAEIALEANPEDLSIEKLRNLSALGVNRLSIGVQSYMPEKLLALGRCHNADEALRTTGEAMNIFGNVSVDLICGAEGETLDTWERDLRIALSGDVPHVSVYMLALEKKTLLDKQVRKRLVTLPGEKTQAAMYLKACELLEADGFQHYEVSNFSKPGFFSRYNLACWQRESYLGFGPSAHTFMADGVQELRSANTSSLVRYIAGPCDALGFSEQLSDEARISEKIFLSLRLSSGLSVDDLLRYHEGSSLVLDAVDQLKEQGLVEICGEVIKVSRKGFLFADQVAEELMPAKTSRQL